VHGRARLLDVIGPAQTQLRVPRAVSTRGLERVEERAIGCVSPVPVTNATGHSRGAVTVSGEIDTKSKPDASALRAFATSTSGGCSSLESV